LFQLVEEKRGRRELVKGKHHGADEQMKPHRTGHAIEQIPAA
jgi:hypothetical protein